MLSPRASNYPGHPGAGAGEMTTHRDKAYRVEVVMPPGGTGPGLSELSCTCAVEYACFPVHPTPSAKQVQCGSGSPSCHQSPCLAKSAGCWNLGPPRTRLGTLHHPALVLSTLPLGGHGRPCPQQRPRACRSAPGVSYQEAQPTQTYVAVRVTSPLQPSVRCWQ